MAKFRKKPVEVEAWEWTGVEGDFESAPDWLLQARNDGSAWLVDNQIVIRTLEGRMFANSGDWIIQGVAGEIYPCKPDIFAETYEMVGD